MSRVDLPSTPIWGKASPHFILDLGLIEYLQLLTPMGIPLFSRIGINTTTYANECSAPFL
jgi:hypothetical protein